jgi:hypothetical protein
MTASDADTAGTVSEACGTPDVPVKERPPASPSPKTIPVTISQRLAVFFMGDSSCSLFWSFKGQVRFGSTLLNGKIHRKFTGR